MKKQYVKMDIDKVKNGIIRDVGGTKNFAVLSAIAVFADSRGVAYPSQKTISQMVGYSRRTVSDTIQGMTKIKVNGKPIISIEVEKTRKGRRNRYTLSPECGFTFGQWL